MPLDEERLSTAIQDEISAVFDIQDASKLETVADAIAKAVVDELKDNAVVNGTTVIAGGSSAGSYPLTSGVVT